MINLTPHPAGTILPVKAQPGAKRNGVSGEHDGMLKVSVCQAPEKGKANRAIVEVLCDALDLRAAQLELISGETSAQKRFVVSGIPAQELAQRIAGVLAALPKGKQRG